MKATLLLLFPVLLCVSFSNVNAQQLDNTYWASYDQANQFNLFWRFNTGTISFSSDSMIYQPVSSYVENGNLITIIDLDSATCGLTDTGRYTFNIQNDTLRFSLLSDNCSSRLSYLISYYFVRIHTGIDDVELSQPVLLFPNPFHDELNVAGNGDLFQISLYDVSGRTVIQRELKNSVQLNTEKLDKGIYFYKLRRDNRKVIKGKIVKK